MHDNYLQSIIYLPDLPYTYLIYHFTYLVYCICSIYYLPSDAFQCSLEIRSHSQTGELHPFLLQNNEM